VAVVLAVLLGPIVQRWTTSDEKVVPGSLTGLAKDAIRLAARKLTGPQPEQNAAWAALAGAVVGKAFRPTWLARWHLILRLNRTATDAYALALLALLQPQVPFLRSPQELWQEARSKLRPSSPAALSAVLALPYEEAERSLELIPQTTSPIAAIADQITLVHINDLFSRLFVRLVDASTKATGEAPPVSVKALLANLEADNMGHDLQSSSFDREIRGVIEGVPIGSASHALGLVLIGLWGIFTGPVAGVQAALASALAAEEVKGAGAALASVSAMLELLYPGTSSTTVLDRTAHMVHLPKNAVAIDKLALVCISYIRLLSSSANLNEQASPSRLQRLEASRSVQHATSQIRLVLTQTDFVGIDDMDSEDESDAGGVHGEIRTFDVAKERLVGVLSVVGRRAARRAGGRDEDSGLEGDLDEL